MAEQGIPFIGPILNRIIGTRNDRFVKKYTQRVNAISEMEPRVVMLTDAELRGKVHELRKKVDGGTKADDLIVEAFAYAREAMDRGVGIRNIFNPKAALILGVYVYAGPVRQNQGGTGCTRAGGAGGRMGRVRRGVVAAGGDAGRAVCGDQGGCTRRAARRSGPRPFDVQLIGGMVLYEGKIAEMATGEGKTFVAPLACFMRVLEGYHCHVVTVNDYLVRRDARLDPPRDRRAGADGRVHPVGHRRAGTAGGSSTGATSRTAPTASSASTTCATT